MKKAKFLRKSNASVICDQVMKKISSHEYLEEILEKIYLGGQPLLVDPVFYLTQESVKESAEFIRQHLDTAVLFRGHYSPETFWKHSLDLARNSGLFLEFGVFRGTSINYFATQRPSTVFHGFDSFEGLPSDWNGWVATKGRFKQEEMPKMHKNVILHKGWFDKTIPDFLKTIDENNISFIHIDCDLYESTKIIFDNLGGMMNSGTVILFDEYLSYPSWKNHEHKAFCEFCNSNNIQYKFKGFYRQKACVIIE